jgi:hypothetical protein
MKKTAAKKPPKMPVGYSAVTFYVPTDLRQRFKVYAAARGLKMKELFQQLFEAHESKDAA